LLAAAVLVLVGTVYGFWHWGSAPEESSYVTVPAQRGNVSQVVSSTGTLQAVVTVSGAPTQPEPAAERGFKIERKYFTLDGKPVDASHARQNERFVVVLRMTEPQPQFGRIIVADYLPAGFEIDNPRLVSSGETGRLAWIEDAQDPVHSEFRDDRFSAAFDRKAGRLVAHAVHREPDAPRGQAAAREIRRELEKLAKWQGANELELRNVPAAWAPGLAG